MAAKMSVLGLVPSSSPYLRSALRGWPLIVLQYSVLYMCWFVYVWIYIWICVCVYVCVCLCIHVSVRICVSLCVFSSAAPAWRRPALSYNWSWQRVPVKYSVHCTVYTVYSTVLYCTLLYSTLLYCPSEILRPPDRGHCSTWTWNWTACTEVQCTALHCTLLHYTVPYYTTLQCTA